MNDTMLAILKVLNKQEEITGSREISRKLKSYGVDLTDRTVRYHLRILDERGYTTVFGKEGRRITPRGRDELSASHVAERVGFVSSKIEALSYQTTFDPESLSGNVILNISHVPESQLHKALQIMHPVFSSPFVMSDRIVLRRSGERIGDMIIPEGKVGIGTVCSVTINSVFLKSGISVNSRFGGVVEIRDGKPSRFVVLVSYEGSSMDPLEIFIRSKMTDVLGALRPEGGRILASFREIPVVCLEEAQRLTARMAELGFGGVLMTGNPNRPLLEVPVGLDKVGVVVVGGLNPVAALEESGIQTESKAMSTLIDYAVLERFSVVAGRLT
ncbi:MAG TPA: NrpR regulatory domain-containing protein [Dissulfurispiraceae bacterium]|nr:NrpR regulatory domain-containing protein [Dissulfurispiraceae bacterium]